MGLRTKFRLMVGVATAGLLALSGFWVSSERSRTLSAKEDQTRSLVEAAYNIAAREHSMEVEGAVSREEGQKRAVATTL